MAVGYTMWGTPSGNSGSNPNGGAVNTVTGTPQGSGVGSSTGGVGTTTTSLPTVPAPGSAPATPMASYSPYSFSWNDINHIAQSLDPDMAATLGFSDYPGKYPQFQTVIGQRLGQPMASGYTASDFRNTLFPNDQNVINTLYAGDRWKLSDVSSFMNNLTNTMDQLEAYRAQQMGVNQPGTSAPQSSTPGTNVPGPPGPGGYGANELAAYLRPLSQQEKDYLNFVQAAQTGKTPRDPAFEASMQGYINQQMQNGQMPSVQGLVGQVAAQQQSSPGVQLYNAAKGMIPATQEQKIREQVAAAMGNIGMRFSSDTGAAMGTALKNAADERMMQGQNLLAQMSTQAALMQAQRQQQAQDALYQEYLRNSGMDPAVIQLMNLISLNRGSTGTGTTILPGANSLSALGKGLAEGGQITSSMGGSVPQQGYTGPESVSGVGGLMNSTGGLQSVGGGMYQDPYGGTYSGF